MCGIAGILQFDRASLKRDLQTAAGSMVESLRHRGPDDQGVSVCGKSNGNAVLGHTRLSIIDLTAAGHQPMSDSQTGNLISFNGEIYNFKEIRQKLGSAGDEWKSQTDTETILAAYAKWGYECLEHLRGMFAFAIWDEQRQELFIARDRLGIKPLYYYKSEDHFLFASEVRSLLASGIVPRHLDRRSVDEYLTYQSVPAPRTLIEGVKVLGPGTWLSVGRKGQVNEKTYWHLLGNASIEAEHATPAQSRKQIKELLQESTALHLISDVPVAAFLSGGIDSSAVVALMREAGNTPQTFSVVFTESAYSEAEFARKAASELGSHHSEILLSEESLLDQLPAALLAMDQPTGDGINTYVVSRAVRSTGAKVALSGLGGDELFAGYPAFARLERLSKYMSLWRRLPSGLRSGAASAAGAFSDRSIAFSKMATMLEGDGSFASVYPSLRHVLSPRQRSALLKSPWKSQNGNHCDPYVSLLRDAFVQNPGFDLLSKVSFAESRTYMHDVLLRDSDQMSMAHALEIRVPLLDHKLVEYVMGLPDAIKRPGNRPKRLFVESLDGLLPKDTGLRPKQGFTLPFDIWMRGTLRGFCEERLNFDRIASRGIMHPEELQKLWKAFLGHHPSVSWSRLWVLVVLEDWLETNEIDCAA